VPPLLAPWPPALPRYAVEPPAAPSPAPTTPAIGPGFATRHTRSPVDGEQAAAVAVVVETGRTTAGVTVAVRTGRGAAVAGGGTVAIRVTRGSGAAAGTMPGSARRAVFAEPTAASLDVAAGLI